MLLKERWEVGYLNKGRKQKRIDAKERGEKRRSLLLCSLRND